MVKFILGRAEQRRGGFVCPAKQGGVEKHVGLLKSHVCVRLANMVCPRRLSKRRSIAAQVVALVYAPTALSLAQRVAFILDGLFANLAPLVFAVWAVTVACSDPLEATSTS